MCMRMSASVCVCVEGKKHRSRLKGSPGWLPLHNTNQSAGSSAQRTARGAGASELH